MKKTAICRPPFKKGLQPEILAENKNLMDYAKSTRLIYTPENQYGFDFRPWAGKTLHVSALIVAVVTGCRAPGL
jgi:RNase P/RNase MRP subunit p29